MLWMALVPRRFREQPKARPPGRSSQSDRRDKIYTEEKIRMSWVKLEPSCKLQSPLAGGSLNGGVWGRHMLCSMPTSPDALAAGSTLVFIWGTTSMLFPEG